MYICILTADYTVKPVLSAHSKKEDQLSINAGQMYSAKTRSDRDKLCHFWSKMKLQESQNKPFLFIASYLVHLILEGFC